MPQVFCPMISDRKPSMIVPCSKTVNKGLLKGKNDITIEKSANPYISFALSSSANLTLNSLIAENIKSNSANYLGRGSFGCVFRSSICNRPVAVKICPRSSCDCRGETNGLLLKKHRNVAQLFKIFHSEVKPDHLRLLNSISVARKKQILNYGMQILVMEYAGSQTLQNIVCDSDELIGSLRRYNFLRQIAKGIRHLHRMGIVHLDLKPSNIVVTDNDCCKIIDFGSSINLDFEHSHRADQSLTGTVAYSAPELFCRGKAQRSCDIYSFGIIMWQLLSRMNPYPSIAADAIVYKVVAQKMRPSFDDLKSIESSFANHTKRKLRPSFEHQLHIKNSYIELANRCWNADSELRPSANYLVDYFQIN